LQSFLDAHTLYTIVWSAFEAQRGRRA
jgi:hypothetical protein